MSKLISDSKLAEFKWPKGMPSFRPKTRKRYSHDVITTSLYDPEVGYVLSFTSEKKARMYMKATSESTNSIEIDYERNEITVENEGFHAA